ncbi:alpha/beta hydrolase [Companilactobacillus sp. HBUAS59699]|uniref:alpha/beta hydrolase n=1 Tax=Companilactobacillus sp. HBUAS59699 TaxID=3109358 RepID=UPI002FEFED6B
MKQFLINENQKINFYKANDNPEAKTIIYIHGGGLLYGDLDDLPHDYINLFINNGYNFLAIDYLLAPESKLIDIRKSVFDAFVWFQKNYSSKLNLNNSKYILFGRSAGSYLCYQLMAQIENEQLDMPAAVLDFYGFYDLNSSKLKVLSNYYKQYPTPSNKILNSLIENKKIYEADIQKRFLLYVASRQKGKWQQYLLNFPTDQIQLDFKQVPPTYIVHCTDDFDVPFSISLNKKFKISKSNLISINKKSHDFDRDVTPENLKIYKNMIDWLDKI